MFFHTEELGKYAYYFDFYSEPASSYGHVKYTYIFYSSMDNHSHQ